MENYTIIVVANGNDEEGKNAAQMCVDNLKGLGHHVLSGRITVDKGGQTDLVTE